MIYDRWVDKEINENLNPYNDIGLYLAKEIKNLIEDYNLPLIEPENKIRATVIGAGAFSLSISGSTCYYDESINLPLENVPIVPINIDSKDLYNEGKFYEFKDRIAVSPVTITAPVSTISGVISARSYSFLQNSITFSMSIFKLSIKGVKIIFPS